MNDWLYPFYRSSGLRSDAWWWPTCHTRYHNCGPVLCFSPSTFRAPPAFLGTQFRRSYVVYFNNERRGTRHECWNKNITCCHNYLRCADLRFDSGPRGVALWYGWRLWVAAKHRYSCRICYSCNQSDVRSLGGIVGDEHVPRALDIYFSKNALEVPSTQSPI